MAKISVEHLKYMYPMTDKLVLNDISFQVEAGEIVGIVGTNGAGKSTLCQALVGLVPNFYKGRYGGHVFIDGMEVTKAESSDLVSKIGIVFQSPFTQVTGSKLTVFEEIAFGPENIGLPREEILKRVEYAMELLDIANYRNRNPVQLSGGQMQRMAIASIIAMRPEVIVFDEPTSQLDPQGSEEVFRAIQTLSKEGMTILIVEHKIEKLARYCDKIILMHDGIVVDYDVPAKVFSNPELEKYQMDYPVFTQICRELCVIKTDGLYPVTLEDTCQLVRGQRGYE